MDCGGLAWDFRRAAFLVLQVVVIMAKIFIAGKSSNPLHEYDPCTKGNEAAGIFRPRAISFSQSGCLVQLIVRWHKVDRFPTRGRNGQDLTEAGHEAPLADITCYGRLLLHKSGRRNKRPGIMGWASI